MKLNGWQRLWVFTGIILGVLLVGFFIITVPSHPKVDYEYCVKMVNLLKNVSEEMKKDFKNVPAERIIERYKVTRNSSEEKFIEEIYKKYMSGEGKGKRLDVVTLYADYKSDKSILFKKHKKHKKHVLFGMVLWIGLMGTIYLLGLGIGWVYKGFKER